MVFLRLGLFLMFLIRIPKWCYTYLYYLQELRYCKFTLSRGEQRIIREYSLFALLGIRLFAYRRIFAYSSIPSWVFSGSKGLGFGQIQSKPAFWVLTLGFVVRVSGFQKKYMTAIPTNFGRKWRNFFSKSGEIQPILSQIGEFF